MTSICENFGVEMTSICENFVDNLSSLHSKLASALDEIPVGPNSNICVILRYQIETILCDFMFLLPLAICIQHKWTDAEGFGPRFGPLVIKIQATIREVKIGELDDVWCDICEMKIGHQATQAVSFNPLKNIRKRASSLSDFLNRLNAKINLLKPEIAEAYEILMQKPSKSHSSMRDFYDWKEIGWLVSSICSCLSELESKRVRNQNNRVRVLDFQKNLGDLQIFLRGLPDIPGVKDVSIVLADVACRAFLVSCAWWANLFSFDEEGRVMTALSDLQRNISATVLETLDQMLRLLKTLKATDYSVSDQKLIEFAQYVLPYWMVTLADKNCQIDQLLHFNQLIFEIEKFFSCELPEDGSLLLNLLPKFWFIKAEAIIIEQLRDKDDLQLSEKCQIIEGLQHIKESPQEHTEDVNQILKFLEEVAELLHSLPSLYFRDARTVVLWSILLKIQFFKLERKLHDYNGSSKFSIIDKVQSFQEWLKILIDCFLSPRGIQKDLFGKLSRYCKARIEALAAKAVSFCHSLLTHNITKDMIESMNLMLADMLDEIKLTMAQLREIFPPVPRSNFPKTNALGFYDSLLSKLQELMSYEANLFVPFKKHIEEILADLQFFRHFLGDNLGLEEENQELRDLCGHVINVAYEAEYLIDSIVDRINSEWHSLIWIYNLLQNIRHIKTQVTKVQEKKSYDIKVHNVPQTSRHVVSKASTPRIDDVVLSLNDQQKLIIDRLVGGYKQRDIVPIVGMPGIGKTTLAKKVYGSPTVAYHFHIRAWCCVTEVYRKRELLLEILSHIIVLTDNIRGMSGENLDFKLRQLLLKKKYLIVMDDMWSTEAWDDLQTSFPDDENGSRILITSRHNHVDLKARAHSDAHHLRLLSDAESWALLQMKIFNEECCPEELIEVGQQIAKNCEGLPLAIVAMAGILERTERQENRWKEIAKNLSSRIVDDPQEQCRDILELSYKFLPDYLQACFLYFGAFLEDQEIPVTKLIRLWIAEGFVQKTDMKSLEDLAEDYLKDLIGRSLVIFAQPRSRGGTKACRVHDMLRNFCQSKAKEDNFLRVITTSNESYESFDDLDFLVNDNFSDPSKYKTYEDHRLCFYLKRNNFIESRPSGPLVRSLLFFGTSDKYARSSYDVSFISHNFRSLKVLDLECINMGPSFPSGIERMMDLRYLAVSGDVESVPSSIANISNLETFVVRGLKGKVNLPGTIWCLKSLRHVHVTDVAVINLKDNELGKSSVLDYLVTLSSPFLRYGEDTNNMLRKFPNLRKLGCIFSGSPDWSGTDNQFPRLDVLTRLESLKISYYGRALNTAEFSFPLSLKKLTLSNFRLPWIHISVIGRLQNLKVLKLLSRAYDGEIWDMVEGEFYNLKFLKLDNLNIAKWNASSDNLPNLEKLVLRNCKHLEEVPSSFVEVCTLRMIEVQWCGKSAEESARRMRDEADECLEVIITSELDSRSSP